MEYLIGTFIFILGVLIGSFLNVVALRYNTGMTVNGRSLCFSCGKKLQWYELIPIFSFIIQRGKCSKCKSKISWQYPLVEFLTGLVFLLIFWAEIWSGVSSTLFYWLMFALLIVITIYDLRHKIIPNGLVYAFIALSFVKLFVSFSPTLSFVMPSWWQIAAGPILFLPFFILWFASQGRWIGLGDGKLALGIGWMLGLAYGTSSLIFAFWIGAIVGIILLALRGTKYTMKTEIPFAPFIILSLFLVYYFHIGVVDFITYVENLF